MALSLSCANSQIYPSGNYSINLNYIFQKKIINFWMDPDEEGCGNTITNQFPSTTQQYVPSSTHYFSKAYNQLHYQT